MRTMAIVVIDEHRERPFEMLRIHDQRPIQTFGSDRSDEPFGDPIGLRHLNWRANDSGSLRFEYRIEATRELAIVIANQEANRPFALGERPRHLSRLLCHPLAVGMRRAAREVDAAAPDFNEKEHIQPLEPDGLDAEEVHGHHAVRLGADKVPPRRTAPLARWTELMFPQDLLDGRRGYDHAQAVQFAHDALVPPPRILTCQPDDQRSNVTADRRSPSASWVRPMIRHQAPVPVQ